jgi:hypothetical protein
MYLREGGEQQPGLPGASVGTRLALAGMTVLTLLIGLFPEPLLRLSIQAP